MALFCVERLGRAVIDQGLLTTAALVNNSFFQQNNSNNKAGAYGQTLQRFLFLSLSLSPRTNKQTNNNPTAKAVVPSPIDGRAGRGARDCQ